MNTQRCLSYQHDKDDDVDVAEVNNSGENSNVEQSEKVTLEAEYSLRKTVENENKCSNDELNDDELADLSRKHDEFAKNGLFGSENRRSSGKAAIVRKLGKYGLDKGVRFGEIIGHYGPKSREAWQHYLVSKKFFFPRNLSSLGFSKEDRNIGVHYLINSFGNLYTSEKYFADSLKHKYIPLLNESHKKIFGDNLLSVNSFTRADFHLDCNFGIDFKLSAGRDYKGQKLLYFYYFIIKRTHVSANSFLRSKPAYRFFKEFQKFQGENRFRHITDLLTEQRGLFARTACDFYGKCKHCDNHYFACKCHHGVKDVLGNFLYLISDCKLDTKVETCYEFDWLDLKFKKIKLSDLLRANLPLGEHRRPNNDKH